MRAFKSTSLADQVFDKLENDIIQGTYPKGEVLTELKLAEQLGVSPHDCMLIGDSEIDIITAENAEFDILSVSWGYCSKNKLIFKGAQDIVNTPEELLEYFK